MFRQVTQGVLATMLGLGIAIGGLTAPAYAAGEDTGMCNENHDRVTIPDSFPLDTCFDGDTMYLNNNTEFPLDLTFIGDDVGKPERYTKAGELVARILDFIQPATFDRQPQINAPYYRSGVVPPKFYVKVKIGKGAATVKTNIASVNAQRNYTIAKAIWDYVPTGSRVGAAKAIAELVRELSDVADQHEKCLDRNTTAWGDLGCQALKGRNIAFAWARAGVDGLGDGAISVVSTTMDVAKWSHDSTRDHENIKKATKSFKVAAVKVPDPPKQDPPKQDPPPNTGGGNSGNPNPGGNNGGGNTGGGVNNPPPPQQPEKPAEPVTQAGVVQNMHVDGPNGLVEDSTPVYLSTRTAPRCKANGCAIDGTDMGSGTTFTAICWVDGDRMTNGNDANPSDDGNPNLVTTTKWIRGYVNGRIGWISAVYTTPNTRNNPNLAHCP